jgi:hypothetical protein
MNLSWSREMCSRTVLSIDIGVLNEHAASILDRYQPKPKDKLTTFLRKTVPPTELRCIISHFYRNDRRAETFVEN